MNGDHYYAKFMTFLKSEKNSDVSSLLRQIHAIFKKLQQNENSKSYSDVILIKSNDGFLGDSEPSCFF